MPDGIKISSLPTAQTAGPDDLLAGVQSAETKKFSLATILAWLKTALAPSDIGAVPDSRTVNSKTLEQDITLAAGDIGYDNQTSGMTATDVQAAVDELDDAKADKATVYTGQAITSTVAGLTYTAINQVTVPAGIYVITASAYNGSNVSGTLLLNLLNYETATSLASNRTSTENGGGNTICAIVELTAASTRIRVRASQTTGSSLSLTENNLTAVRVS